MKRAVLFLNGELKGDKKFYQAQISKQDYVVAVDGGAKHLYELDILPGLIIGDLDSVPENILSFYKKQQIEIKKFPVEKDKTDTELILDRLIEQEFREIIIFAALGGRVDHQLANLLLLANYDQQESEIKIVTPNEEISLITNKKIIKGHKGKTISLLSLSEKSVGITLTGFKYDLTDGIIKQGSSLGLSNVIKQKEAEIKVDSGKLLLIINS